ncbi:hypothetical protein F4782DRAFT_542033 [Xylaria castorea]|nr:hypothetical protein F4782DRAFT_542033 [Xylaria castorea]
MTEKQPFRVIVVGAGLLGLTAAHILAKTDMDFVVLEQHDDLLPEIGSLLSLMPPTFRVLDQLGVLEAIEPILTRVAGGVFMSAVDAKVYREEDLGRLIETNHGHGVSVVHRPHYVKALYDSLPEEAKARIHVRKRVARIDVADDDDDDGPAETGQPSPFATTYRVLFGNLPALPDLAAGVNFEGAADGVSTQVMTGAARAWFAVYERLAATTTTTPPTTTTSARRSWTEDDKREILRRWGRLYVAPGYTVDDAYARRDGDVGLINLEEGLLDDMWSWKRIPHAGLGYNSGVADLVVLINGLRKLLTRRQAATTTTTTTTTTTGDLEMLFHAYQAQRMEDTPTIVAMSERRARMCAWLGVRDWFMARFVVPLFPLGEYSVNHILGPIISRTPVLDWLDEKRLPARAVPYVHHPRTETREKLVYNAATAPPSGSRLPLLTGTLVVAALATVGLRVYRRI